MPGSSVRSSTATGACTSPADVRRIAAATAVLAFAFGVAACGGGDDAGAAASHSTARGASTTTTRPLAQQLCAAADPVQTGTLQDPELVELSGLAASRTHSSVLWASNDSGDSARIFALDPAGAAIATIAVTGAEARDWEDIAAGDDALYIGDIGDNFAQRPSVTIYRVDEPDPAAGTDVEATAIELTYPDGPHDAEALMVDGPSRNLVIVTKELSGTSGVYVAPLDTPGRLELIASLDLGVGQLVTGGDISAGGMAIALRTYGKLFLWTRAEGESLAGAFGGAPCEAPVAREAQGEAVAFVGRGYVTISEGEGAPIWTVSASEPASTSSAGTPGTSSSG